MKKLGLTLALASILTLGTSQAVLADGVIISDSPQCNPGVIISDTPGVIISDLAGMGFFIGEIGKLFAGEIKNDPCITPPGVIISDSPGVIISD